MAGIDGVRRELEEIVLAIRCPEKFRRIGARCPRGVLLAGPSGTGKTLLAAAVAAEADVPFLSCSGSAFVELLVGRGAARVRELFARARKCAPCVVFIDEIDAVAKARGLLGQSDEREQTLNQILCELDGFDSKDDDPAKLVVLIAATNRAEILDAALVRPGRLDRTVIVPLPDEKGRAQILKLHAKRIRLEPGTDLDLAAKACRDFSGAELANVINESALLAVRDDCTQVATKHLDQAIAKTHATRAHLGIGRNRR